VSPRRILQIVGTIELATLVVLLANLVTVHLPELSRVLGPVHGLAYTGTVITAVLLSKGRRRVWLFSLIPGVRGLLASRTASPAITASGGD